MLPFQLSLCSNFGPRFSITWRIATALNTSISAGLRCDADTRIREYAKDSGPLFPHASEIVVLRRVTR